MYDEYGRLTISIIVDFIPKSLCFSLLVLLLLLCFFFITMRLRAISLSRKLFLTYFRYFPKSFRIAWNLILWKANFLSGSLEKYKTSKQALFNWKRISWEAINSASFSDENRNKSTTTLIFNNHMDGCHIRARAHTLGHPSWPFKWIYTPNVVRKGLQALDEFR